jgi:hypothetical protein
MEMDVQIALMELEERRIHRKLERDKWEEYINKPLKIYTTSEIIEDIKIGKTILDEEEFSFESRNITGMELELAVLKNFYTEMEEDLYGVNYKNLNKKVMFMLSLMDETKIIANEEEWVDAIIEDIKTVIKNTEVKKEEKYNNLTYIIHIVPDIGGRIYNISFRGMKSGKRYYGEASCMSKDRYTIGIILESIVRMFAETTNGRYTD